jgi:hypothetical protein
MDEVFGRHSVTQLTFKNGDLMPQRQDLHVLFRSLIGSRRSNANALVMLR